MGRPRRPQLSWPGRDDPAPAQSSRRWIARARLLARDRQARVAEAACYVEGIRQTLAAIDAGLPVEALLVDPTRLRSEVAWEAVARAREAGAEYVTLKPEEFARVSSRDNPVGIAAIVRWSPRPLEELVSTPDGLYAVAVDVHDPGNLGTLIRTLDAAGGQSVIICGGTDPAHPTALRAALGTTFTLPIHAAPDVDAVFAWARACGVRTIATTAHAGTTLWNADLALPVAVLVGSEGAGLGQAIIERCDVQVSIPMFGASTSLNVSVAAGIVLYEVRRRFPLPHDNLSHRQHVAERAPAIGEERG